MSEEVAEDFKSLAYAFKDLQNQEKGVSQKILRILRDHEKRIKALEAKK